MRKAARRRAWALALPIPILAAVAMTLRGLGFWDLVTAMVMSPGAIAAFWIMGILGLPSRISFVVGSALVIAAWYTLLAIAAMAVLVPRQRVSTSFILAAAAAGVLLLILILGAAGWREGID